MKITETEFQSNPATYLKMTRKGKQVFVVDDIDYKLIIMVIGGVGPKIEMGVGVDIEKLLEGEELKDIQVHYNPWLQ